MLTQTRYSTLDIQYYFICIPVTDLIQSEQDELEEIIYSITTKHNCNIHEMTILNDQIFLLFSSPINISISKIINVLKSHSSFLLRKKFTRLKKYDNLWVKGYFLATVGMVTDNKVKRAIRKIRVNNS